MPTTLRKVAHAVLVIYLFVDHKVLADNNNATRADVTWHLQQGMGCLVNREDVFADDMV